LVDFNGLTNLTTIGDHLGVYGNDSLINFDGLDSLTTIQVSLNVTDNPALVDFSGLETLTIIEEQDFTVSSNHVLADVTALHGLTSIGDAFTISDNVDLLTEDAEALRDAIGTENIGGTVTISGNK